MRRALTIYNKVQGSIKKIEQVASILDDELKSHKTVIGEELYLFILGRETLLQVFKDKQVINRSEIDRITMYALYAHMASRNSVDVSSVIVSFAHHLGQIAQTYEPSFTSHARTALMSDDGKYVLKDPVLTYLANNKGSIPTAEKAICESFGIDKAQWQSLAEAAVESILSIEWRTMATELPKHLKIVPGQTFIGLVLRGANSVAHENTPAIQLTIGPDAIGICTASLMTPSPFIARRQTLPDIRVITKEMIDVASQESMYSRGFVPTVNSGWTHASEAVKITEKATDSRPEKSYFMKKDTSTFTVSAQSKEASDPLNKANSALKVVEKLYSAFSSPTIVRKGKISPPKRP
jgi:hypothetical protein